MMSSKPEGDIQTNAVDSKMTDSDRARLLPQERGSRTALPPSGTFRTSATFSFYHPMCQFWSAVAVLKQYRSGLLLPFFCLQLFDFFITLLTSVHLMSYYPHLEYDDGISGDHFPNNQEFMQWKENISHTKVDIESRWFVFIALVMFLCIMTVKVYCIVCVWACYQHTVSVEVKDYKACMTDDPEVMDSLKPPCYNDALKDSMFKPPPPPYLEFH